MPLIWNGAEGETHRLKFLADVFLHGCFRVLEDEVRFVRQSFFCQVLDRIHPFTESATQTRGVTNA